MRRQRVSGWFYAPDSRTGEEHTLRLEDLYTVPVCGWLRTAIETGPDEGARVLMNRAVIPTIFPWHNAEEPTLRARWRRKSFYSARVQVPPGIHKLEFASDSPRFVRLVLGGQEIEPSDRPRYAIDFNLDDTVNGELLEIEKIDSDADSWAKLILLDDPHRAVPPYEWFQPARPSRELIHALQGRGEPEPSSRLLKVPGLERTERSRSCTGRSNCGEK